MTRDIPRIYASITDMLRENISCFKVISDTSEKFEVIGTIPTKQGKHKMDGMYFATVVPKSKDVRLYFFPIYTHAEGTDPIITDELRKFLKGKTCFHVRYLNDHISDNLKILISTGVALYQRDGLLAK